MSRAVLCLILCMLTITTIPMSAQTDHPTCPPDFVGFLSPRLSVGNTARVLAGVELNVRPQPNTARARIAAIFAGEMFTLSDGPVCDEGYVWWKGVFDDFSGWIAEGSVYTKEYWLEPRGDLMTIIDDSGQARLYVQAISDNSEADGLLEPADCLRPPDDYTIIQQDYARLNLRTWAMLDQAQRVYDAISGGTVNFRQAITQGSYNEGQVSASFGTHDGGGAVDISVLDPETWQVRSDDIDFMIEALRIAGFAAWLRDNDELYPGSIIHIHAIAVGDMELSPAARLQIDGERGYLRSFNGLPEDYAPEPVPDRHGGPIICGWMVEDGFPDLREQD